MSCCRFLLAAATGVLCQRNPMKNRNNKGRINGPIVALRYEVLDSYVKSTSDRIGITEATSTVLSRVAARGVQLGFDGET